MRMEIYKEFSFEAAHRLPNVPPGHKCARLHGHSYRIRIYLEGPVQPETGWVADFATISAALRPVIAQLDHYYLNEIQGLENPTSENLARWLWQRTRSDLPLLSKIMVLETCTSACIYTENGDP